MKIKIRNIIKKQSKKKKTKLELESNQKPGNRTKTGKTK